jgi:hypothetical protein
MSAYALGCIATAWVILAGLVCTVPARFRRTSPPDDGDYPTTPIPTVPGLPPVPPPGPAPSQHFTDGTWGRAVDQHLVDVEFDSLIAFQTERTDSDQ